MENNAYFKIYKKAMGGRSDEEFLAVFKSLDMLLTGVRYTFYEGALLKILLQKLMEASKDEIGDFLEVFNSSRENDENHNRLVLTSKVETDVQKMLSDAICNEYNFK